MTLFGSGSVLGYPIGYGFSSTFTGSSATMVDERQERSAPESIATTKKKRQDMGYRQRFLGWAVSQTDTGSFSSSLPQEDGSRDHGISIPSCDSPSWIGFAQLFPRRRLRDPINLAVECLPA